MKQTIAAGGKETIMKRWTRAACVLAAVALTACTPTTEFPTQEGETETETEQTTEMIDMEMVFIYRCRDGVFERVTLDAEEVTEQLLLDKLIEYGVLETDTEILSFDIASEETSDIHAEQAVGPGGGSGAGTIQIRTGTLDLSKVPAWPADTEEMMLWCIGNTFVDNLQLDGLRLLVNGSSYSGTSVTLGEDDYLEFESGYKNAPE